MTHYSYELAVKAASLAAEARIIRRAIKAAAKRKDFAEIDSLQSHRRDTVKREARATHLARAFLKGTPYVAVEAKLRPETRPPESSKILSMVRRYGKTGLKEEELRDVIVGWLKGEPVAAVDKAA